MKKILVVFVLLISLISKSDAQQYEQLKKAPYEIKFYSKPYVLSDKIIVEGIDSVKVIRYIDDTFFLEIEKDSNTYYIFKQALKDDTRFSYYKKKRQIEKDRISFEAYQAAKKQREKEEIEREKEKERQKELRIANINKKYPPATAKKILEGLAWIGMTEEMLIDSWGEPTDINKTITAYSVSKQYVYNHGYDSQYIYFDDGKCTSISD